MTHKIKNTILTLLMIIAGFTPLLVPLNVAACNGIANNVSAGVNYATGSSGDNCSSTHVTGSSIGSIAKEVVKIFSIIVGAVAIIMLIYGGFRYITSGGDSNRVGSAKNTIIYAIIGLVIVALAQIIVHFVLYQSSNISNGTISSS